MCVFFVLQRKGTTPSSPNQPKSEHETPSEERQQRLVQELESMKGQLQSAKEEIQRQRRRSVELTKCLFGSPLGSKSVCLFCFLFLLCFVLIGLVWFGLFCVLFIYLFFCLVFGWFAFGFGCLWPLDVVSFLELLEGNARKPSVFVYIYSFAVDYFSPCFKST